MGRTPAEALGVAGEGSAVLVGSTARDCFAPPPGGFGFGSGSGSGSGSGFGFGFG
ncbi:hypothetical protein ACTWP5_20020 [Streptomyces sp. 4N509B]|uniref:hypothetical protein n=1 Tax=Streptomyces sp. 4N509B TaxID=3457413 RepID=UPI003FD1730F